MWASRIVCSGPTVVGGQPSTARGGSVNLLGYWGVLKSQWGIVVLGIAVSVLLSVLALYRVSPDGVSLRSPPVYVAKSTLLVTGGVPRADGTSVAPEYLAQIWAQLAQSDAVHRLIDPTLKRDLWYGVDPVTGVNSGTPLPLLSVSAYSTSPSNSVALANRVARSLKQYIATTQRTFPKRQQSTLTIVARAVKADVFKGKRLTPSLMLFVLGITGTIFLAFTRHNLRLARSVDSRADAVQVSHGETAQLLREENAAPLQEHEGRLGEAAGAQPLEDVATARRRRTLGSG